MKDNPFIISLLIGLIVILVIAGVSVLVKMNSLSNVYKRELAKSISLEKTIEDLKKEKSAFQEEIAGLQAGIQEREEKIKALNEELDKAGQIKQKLEESLKEELMKNKLKEE